MVLWLLEKVSRGWAAKDEVIPKIRTNQRQISEYQQDGMPFGLGYGYGFNANFTFALRQQSGQIQSCLSVFYR